MSLGTQVASLYGVLSLKDEMTPALSKAESGAKRFGSKMQSMGSKMTSFGASLLPISAGLTLIGKSGLGAAADFEMSMKEISARTGIVGDDLQAISDFALQMGADTMFSAGQAADAFLQLLTSGQSAEEAVLTLRTVMDLAAASGEDLGYTADALTDIMAAFNLEVTDAAMVSDALARAAGASSADIASLAEGFANVGPVARQFGLDVDTTAAALAVLAENGIKGAEAGTALKSMLMNMTRDTEEVTGAWDALGTSFYNADGSARPLAEVLASIKAGMEGMPAEEQNRLMQDLAGSYGIVALSALLGDLTIEGMAESMEGQATAAEVANARMDTFKGTIDQVKGSIETAMINAFMPFMENSLKPMAEALIPIINSIGEWAAENPELASTILGVGLAVIALSGGMLILGPLVGAMGTLIGGLAAGMMLFGGVAGIVTVLLAAYATNFGGFADAIRDTQTALDEGDLEGTLLGVGSALLAIPLGIAGLFVDTDQLSSWVGIWDNLKTIVAALPGYVGSFVISLASIVIPGGLNDTEGALSTIKQIVLWIQSFVPGIFASLNIPMPAGLQQIADVVGGIKSALEAIMGGGGSFEVPASDVFQYQATDPRLHIPADVRAGEGHFRAAGGPVSAGSAYIVGEQGAEMFIPGTSGSIVPNHAIGGGGGDQTIILMLPDGSVLYEAVLTEGQRRGQVMAVMT